MKNFLVLLFTVLFTAQSFAARPAWQTALIDAAGALQGGSAALTVLPHPAAGLAGAVLGGAAASMAGKPNVNPNKYNFMPNPANPYDAAGQKHNMVIVDFISSKPGVFGLSNYESFIKQNAFQYGVEEQYMPSSSIISACWNFEKFNYDDDKALVDFVLKRAPLSVDKKALSSVLYQIVRMRDLNEFKSKINAIEDSYLKSVNKEAYVQMAIFFSVLRNSSALWGD